jgi:hypothetical protein
VIAAVVGVGAVGARAARQLVSTDGVESLVVADRQVERSAAVCTSLGEVATAVAPEADEILAQGVDVVLLAHPAGTHARLAGRLLAADVHVVSTSDALEDVTGLLDLDSEARERGCSVVAGAGYSPGLSCLLARHAAGMFDEVDEIHVARLGTGGPACARQRRRALTAPALAWRDGWVERGIGSGRELVWFPDPIGGHDCSRAALPDPLLLVPAFPGISRVTVAIAAGPGERLLARLPARPKPPPDRGLGALRVEVRGRQGSGRRVEVYGSIDRPTVAAGAVAALACRRVVDGEVTRRGAGGLAELVDPLPMLTELADRGVKAAVFEGAPT